jgi:hypothetical protein
MSDINSESVPVNSVLSSIPVYGSHPTTSYSPRWLPSTTQRGAPSTSSICATVRRRRGSPACFGFARFCKCKRERRWWPATSATRNQLHHPGFQHRRAFRRRRVPNELSEMPLGCMGGPSGLVARTSSDRDRSWAEGGTKQYSWQATDSMLLFRCLWLLGYGNAIIIKLLHKLYCSTAQEYRLRKYKLSGSWAPGLPGSWAPRLLGSGTLKLTVKLLAFLNSRAPGSRAPGLLNSWTWAPELLGSSAPGLCRVLG